MSPTDHSVQQLESPAELRHLRIEWYIERAGWALAGGILLAALLGFLGPGPLGKRQASSPQGVLNVHYQKILRNQAPASLNMRVARPSAGLVRLSVSHSFTNRVQVEQISPQPQAVTSRDGHLVYDLLLEHSSAGQIVIDFQPEQFGTLNVELAIDGEAVQLRQYVLP